MKRFVLVFVLILLGCYPVMAQNPAMEEIVKIMNHAFSLEEKGDYQEALNYYLNVGEYTRIQSNETEHQIYVSSQIAAIKCYEQLEQFDDAFQLCEELLDGTLNNIERNWIQEHYVYNGYLLSSTPTIERTILEKIYPLADREMQQRIRKRLPKTWELEGLGYSFEQNFDRALACFENARIGYHEVANAQGEMNAWCHIGDVKKNFMIRREH